MKMVMKRRSRPPQQPNQGGLWVLRESVGAGPLIAGGGPSNPSLAWSSCTGLTHRCLAAGSPDSDTSAGLKHRPRSARSARKPANQGPPDPRLEKLQLTLEAESFSLEV